MTRKNYLDVNYSKDEYGKKDYPQQLCDHLVATYLSRFGSVQGKTILDVGSGKGAYLVGFERCGMHPSGLDKRAECVGVLENFDIRCNDIEDGSFPFDSDSFDILFSKSVIEHVADTDGFLAEALRVLKPGSPALIMAPDWGSQHRHFFDDYTHVKPFTRKGLQNALVLNGFEVVACEYFLQLPVVWKYPWMRHVCTLVSLLPDFLRFKDADERQHRKFIRFSKEKMLLALAVKPAA